MNRAEWFGNQMLSSTEALEWGIGQVTTERLFMEPPSLLGKWPAARHLFHLMHYETYVALPGINLWLGGDYPSFGSYNEQRDWDVSGKEIAFILSQFREARALLGEIFTSLPQETWDSEKDTPWGRRSLYWVISKTFQHSTEHMNNILRIALLWEHYEARSRKIDEAFL